MNARSLFVFILFLIVSAAYSSAEQPVVTVTESTAGVKVMIGDQLFTEYVTKSKTKPILWPINGPTNVPMTRAWPMGEQPNEKQDHPHHRSFWFTHGEVNGVDFWMEEETKGKKPGTIEHQKFTLVQSGTATEPARLTTTNIWKAPDGKPVLDDTRELAFGADATARWIDFKITMHANYDAIKFGDTKEGSFGVRIAESAKVEAKLGGKIVNSRGQTDGDTWGKQAEWVDYHGPMGADKARLGIAILNHPESFRHPTHWHVRTYGLFAANPFGIHDFEKKKEPVGEHTVAKGDKLVLRYRVILHVGDEQTGNIAERYKSYAK